MASAPVGSVDLKVVARPKTLELPSTACSARTATRRTTITRGVTGLIVTAGPGQLLSTGISGSKLIQIQVAKSCQLLAHGAWYETLVALVHARQRQMRVATFGDAVSIDERPVFEIGERH